MSTRSVLSNVHYPSNVMLNWWIIAVTRFAFSRRSWIDRGFVFNYCEESWNGTPSAFTTTLCSIFPPFTFVASTIASIFRTATARQLFFFFSKK